MINSQIGVDSLKVRIPIKEVTIINDSIFGTKYIVDESTGDVEREYKESSYKVSYDGITTWFGLESQVTGEQKVKDYLVILFNSKLLGANYFDGLNYENCKYAYQQIIKMDVVSFSLDAFLEGEGTDVDIKADFYQNDISMTIRTIDSHAKPSKEMGRGSNKFDKPTNKGIEFGSRKKATPSNPFLKFYAKGLELLNSSNVFYKKHLLDQNLDLTKLLRAETTIKNRKHFKKFGITDTSLRSILSLSQDKLSEILKNSISIHLEKRLTTTNAKKDLRPMDRIQFNAMALLISQGANYNLVAEMLLQGINDKVAKSRKRKSLDKIYRENIKGSDGDVMAEDLAKFCDAVGWV